MTTTAESAKLLCLVAFDEDDLSVISAHLQDALIPVAELAYLPKEKRFALVGKRFDWVKAAAGGCERCATGLHFDYVTAVARSGFDQADSARVLALLAIAFEPGDAPGGAIVLTFSGGAAVKLQVECIEGQMRDLGPRWPCHKVPKHVVEMDV